MSPWPMESTYERIQGEAEIVRTALDLCRQNLEDPLIEVVGPLC
jgi:hypothetical protein